MYALRNKVQLIGNVGQQPDLQTTEAGHKWVRFSIATSEVYQNAKGDKVKETQWHQLIAWDNLAEIVSKYLPRGREVAIEGKLVHRSYTDKEGVKRYSTNVVVTEILFLGKNN